MAERVTDLESALQATERAAADAADAARRLQATARRAVKAAAVGDLKAVRQALAALVESADRASESAASAAGGWAFASEADEERYFEDGRLTRELLIHAKQAGLGLFEIDGQLTSFPSLIRVVPKDRIVTIDRKPHRQVRPSKLIAHLQEMQERPTRFKPDAFLEVLHAAYGHAVASSRAGRRSAVVKFTDLYRILTLLPAARKDYTIQEFARDVFQLDQSGISRTRSDARLRLDSGATGAKNRSQLLVVVDRHGAEKSYYGLEFLER